MSSTHGQGTRSLKRVGLDDAMVQRLAMRSMLTAKDVLLKTELEVMEVLDVTWEVAQDVVSRVSRSICPSGRPVSELRAAAAASATGRSLPTRLPALDEALRGGVPAGGITELVGPAGVGKTQLCLMLSVFATLPPEHGGLGGSVLYFDTESKFSSARLVEIARAHFPLYFSSEKAVTQLTENVLVVNVGSSGDLVSRLAAMEGAVIDRRVRLIVLDSVASLARTEYGAGQIVARQEMLGRQAAALKYTAESFGIPAVVTNQVTTRFGKEDDGGGGGGGGRGQGGAPVQQMESYLTAALGTKWAHCVNTRLVLEKLGPDRYVKVAKSPISPVVSCPYRVGEGGLEPDAGAAAAPAHWGAQASVTSMAIGNEAGYGAGRPPGF